MRGLVRFPSRNYRVTGIIRIEELQEYRNNQIDLIIHYKTGISIINNITDIRK